MNESVLVPVVTEQDTVRMRLFPKAVIDRAVADMIPQLPPGRQHGIGFATDETGATFAVLFGDKDGQGVDWQVAGAVKVGSGVKPSGGVSGHLTW